MARSAKSAGAKNLDLSGGGGLGDLPAEGVSEARFTGLTVNGDRKFTCKNLKGAEEKRDAVGYIFNFERDTDDGKVATFRTPEIVIPDDDTNLSADKPNHAKNVEINQTNLAKTFARLFNQPPEAAETAALCSNWPDMVNQCEALVAAAKKANTSVIVEIERVRKRNSQFGTNARIKREYDENLYIRKTTNYDEIVAAETPST